jgi:hypothetical protein
MARAKDEKLQDYIVDIRRHVTDCNRAGRGVLQLTGEEWARRVTALAEELAQGTDPDQASHDELPPAGIRDLAARLAATAYVLALVDEDGRGDEEDEPESDDAPVAAEEAAA